MVEESTKVGARKHGAWAWVILVCNTLVSLALACSGVYSCYTIYHNVPRANYELIIVALFGPVHLVSAACSIILMVSPKAWTEPTCWPFYMPTWFSIGHLIVCLGYFPYSAFWQRYGGNLRSVLVMLGVSASQVILHTVIMIALSGRSKGQYSGCLPWNINEEGKVQCC